MKKILLTSTALVAAGLMSAGAASAAEKIKLSLGGNSTWWVAGVWNDDDYTHRANGGSRTANVDVKGNNILNFSGSTALDNGLKVGVMITVPAGGHSDSVTDSIDQSYAWIEGGFGKVMAGMHANGTALLHVAAPDSANNYMILGNWAVAKPATVMGMNQRVGYTTSSNNTAITTDDKAEKITYVSPKFYGLTLGATYVPNAGRTSATGLGQHSRGTPTDGLQAFGGGALYANTFGPVGVKASAGYVYVDLSELANQSSHDWQQQAYGAQLSYAGFTLGGSYQRATDNRRQGGVTSAPLTNTSQVGSIKGGTLNLDFGGSAYDVGLEYASGPYAVSFKYYHSSVIGITDSATRNGKDDTIDIYQASGKYNLGPGVDVLATVGYAEYKDQRDGTGTTDLSPKYSNSGWTAMTGLSLTF